MIDASIYIFLYIYRNEADYEKRWNVVMQQIIENGHYDLTSDELKFGARTAWRNAPRCPGRTAWNTLALRDCRHVTSVEEVFNEICTHIKESSNNGNIIPTISVFPERRHGRHDQFRVWNAQLINFAGYTSDDDVVIGDKGNFAFTKVNICILYLYIVYCSTPCYKFTSYE